MLKRNDVSELNEEIGSEEWVLRLKMRGLNPFHSGRFGWIANLIDHSEPEPLQESIKYLRELKKERKIICEDTGVIIVTDCSKKKSCHVFIHNPSKCINDEETCWWLK